MNKGQSESIAALAEALSLFQGEVEDIVKDKKGYNYSYGDLGQVLQVARPLLSKHGLAVTLFPISRGDKVGVKAKLLHKSGEWMAESILVNLERPPVNKWGKETLTMIQVAGSVITYLRRYATASILGMTQVDDDGALGDQGEVTGNDGKKEDKNKNYARPLPPATMVPPVHQFTNKQVSGLHQQPVPLSPPQKVSESTYALLCSLMLTNGISDERIEGWKKYFNVDSLENLSEKSAKGLIKTINKHEAEKNSA